MRAFFVFAKERQRTWSIIRHETALNGTSAADAIEVTRRQQTDLIAKLMGDHWHGDSPARVEATAELVVGACERLAIWRERHDEVTPEQTTEYAINLLWSGLFERAR